MSTYAELSIEKPNVKYRTKKIHCVKVNIDKNALRPYIASLGLIRKSHPHRNGSLQFIFPALKGIYQPSEHFYPSSVMKVRYKPAIFREILVTWGKMLIYHR